MKEAEKREDAWLSYWMAAESSGSPGTDQKRAFLAGWQSRASEESDGWISVDKQLPDDSALVMFWMPDWKFWDVGIYRSETDLFVTEATYGYDDEPHTYTSREVTHWRLQSSIPLPSPPSAAQETGK